jgi:hypothetical protein
MTTTNANVAMLSQRAASPSSVCVGSASVRFDPVDCCIPRQPQASGIRLALRGATLMPRSNGNQVRFSFIPILHVLSAGLADAASFFIISDEAYGG